MMRNVYLVIGILLWVAIVVMVGPLVEDLFRLLLGWLR